MEITGFLVLLILFLISETSFGKDSIKIFDKEEIYPFSLKINQTFFNLVEMLPSGKCRSISCGLNDSPNVGQNGD